MDEIPELETSFKAMGKLIHKASEVAALLFMSSGDGTSSAAASRQEFV